MLAEDITERLIVESDTSGPLEMLQFFQFEHLPLGQQKISQVFARTALSIIDETPASTEQTVSLRKLLEAKDAAVRASLL